MIYSSFSASVYNTTKGGHTKRPLHDCINPTLLDKIQQFKLTEQQSEEYLADDEMESKGTSNKHRKPANSKSVKKDILAFPKMRI